MSLLPTDCRQGRDACPARRSLSSTYLLTSASASTPTCESLTWNGILPRLNRGVNYSRVGAVQSATSAIQRNNRRSNKWHEQSGSSRNTLFINARRH